MDVELSVTSQTRKIEHSQSKPAIPHSFEDFSQDVKHESVNLRASGVDTEHQTSTSKTDASTLEETARHGNRTHRDNHVGEHDHFEEIILMRPSLTGFPEQGYSLARWLDMDNSSVDDDESILEDPPVLPMYMKGPLVDSECTVCLEMVKEHSRACCSEMVCDSCGMEYINQKIQEGNVHFTCPAYDCAKPVSRDEILSRLKDEAVREKYHRFLTNANSDPGKKTCPHCCLISEQPAEPCSKYGRPIVCEQCDFHWCFDCHSPSHPDVKCKANVKGLKALKAWTKGSSNGQRNARKCPKCKLLIQRASGCDHMKCNICKTNFCYKCGGKILRARFLFGNHHNKFSVLGCPHKFMDGKRKHLRRLIRGSIFSGVLISATVVSGLLVGVLPIAAILAGPVIGFVRLHKYMRAKRLPKQALPPFSERSAMELENRLRFAMPLAPRRDITLENEADLERFLNMMEFIPMETHFIYPDTMEIGETPGASLASSSEDQMSSGMPSSTHMIADKNETTCL